MVLLVARVVLVVRAAIRLAVRPVVAVMLVPVALVVMVPMVQLRSCRVRPVVRAVLRVWRVLQAQA